MTNIDAVKEKIKKLLAQADDQAGTPEGDAFLAKAMDVAARYGVETADLDYTDGGEVICREVTFSGTYTDMQAYLLFCIANALHCNTLRMTAYSSTKVKKVYVFGRERHIERAMMLWTILNPRMKAQADDQAVYSLSSNVVAKRSFMRGFASTINARLKEAEQRATDDAGERYALAVIDDAKLAQNKQDEWLAERNMQTSARRNHYRHDSRSYAGGVNAGERADIGNQRIANRAAITA